MREANPDVVDDLGYAPYPTVEPGEPPTATLGGMNYAISTYSKHPDEAFDAAMCLRNAGAPARATRSDAGNVPALDRRVFDEPEFKKAYPMTRTMLTELKNAVPRPVSPVYQNISTVVSTTLSPPAAINPQATADELRTRSRTRSTARGSCRDPDTDTAAAEAIEERQDDGTVEIARQRASEAQAGGAQARAAARAPLR